MTKIIAITPFFSSQEEFADNFSKLEETVKRLKEQTDTNLIGIINDAPKLELPYIYQDFTLSSPKTQGKEWAIIQGLSYILEQYTEVEHIIQTDYDLEQNPADAQKMLEYSQQQNIQENDNVLLIGDRYQKMGKENINQYRETVLDIQSALSNVFWYNIQDITSGLRMYTKTFAQHFLNQAKGKGFSADLDQFIIAYLTQATVIPIPLENAMPRSMYTKWAKLIQVFQGLLAHKESLIKIWKEDIIYLFENIIKALQNWKDVEINLSQITLNWKTYIYRNMWDDKYSLQYL